MVLLEDPIRMIDYDIGKKGVFDSKHCTIFGTENFIMIQ